MKKFTTFRIDNGIDRAITAKTIPEFVDSLKSYNVDLRTVTLVSSDGETTVSVLKYMQLHHPTVELVTKA